MFSVKLKIERLILRRQLFDGSRMVLQKLLLKFIRVKNLGRKLLGIGTYLLILKARLMVAKYIKGFFLKRLWKRMVRVISYLRIKMEF